MSYMSRYAVRVVVAMTTSKSVVRSNEKSCSESTAIKTAIFGFRGQRAFRTLHSHRSRHTFIHTYTHTPTLCVHSQKIKRARPRTKHRRRVNENESGDSGTEKKRVSLGCVWWFSASCRQKGPGQPAWQRRAQQRGQPWGPQASSPPVCVFKSVRVRASVNMRVFTFLGAAAGAAAGADAPGVGRPTAPLKAP